MRDENVHMSEAHKNDHSLLDEFAFEALSGYHQKLVWKKKQLHKLFGEEFYNQYIRVGILVEDDVLDCDVIRVEEFHDQYNVEVRFYHKLFCEWYAAHYLARNVSKLSSNAAQLLGNLDPFDLQYVYRFACGLNKDASEHIIKYLQRTDEGQKFAILCILEQEDNMQDCVEIVKKLVSYNVEIHQNDNRLLQRSTLQILEFSSNKEIPITCLYLNKSYKECEGSNIVLHSGITLTYPSTLQHLKIEMGKDEETCEPKSLSEEEINAIFQYVLRCRAFKKLS
ncbi:hypothetical protein BSL78_19296 [Apostichopus japonicus]|uniref:Uncharacterized protein n=1 Tax=Stichopus japonicus TaxID=307972 RepID=A0A2G8K772_STIJA|nr:hypothetical protein BSL78_19296 [Apostichopus japonicus]